MEAEAAIACLFIGTRSMRSTERLLDLFVRNRERTSDPAVRGRYGALEAWVSIVANTLMAGVKLALGGWINSIALIADAGHTLSDTLTSIVVLIGFRAARQPIDAKHPHGHGRMESIATLIIATLLGAVGLNFLIESIQRLIHPAPVGASWLVVAVLILSALAKEWMARFSEELGRAIQSSALKADAWHHRSDAVASALVAVAIAGAFLRIGWLDGLFGLGVSLLILYCGVDLIRSSASWLMGESPDVNMIREVEAAAQSVPGVVSIHDVEFHDYGPHKDVSLHVEVPSHETAAQAHEIATAVEEAVNRRLNVSTVVHVDPLDDLPGIAPEYEVRAVIEQVLRATPEVAGFHAITVSGSQAGQSAVNFHVVVSRQMDLAKAHGLSHEINRRVSERLPGYKVTIHMEPCDDGDEQEQAEPPR
jgi:cation diffusion facilitator family transporter